MKPIMAWIKAHLMIVAMTAVIIVVLPVGYVGSSIWNKKIRTARQAEATKMLGDLQAARISYSHPSPLPGGQAITLNLEAPNPRVTEYFAEHRERLKQQVGRVVEVAEQVNSQGHEPLIKEGLFPRPVNQFKTLDMADILVGKGERPSAYKELFRRINAGGPADPIQLANALNDRRSEKLESIQATTGRTQFTQEEEIELRKELAALRLGFYQQHAQTISVYATMDVLPREVPRTTPNEPPSIEQCFKWQFDYWTIADLLRAVDNANTEGGQRQTVDQAVVKRIERIALEPIVPEGSSEPSMGMGGMYGEPMAAEAPRNPITGRSGGPANTLYDVRNATMVVVVSSARLTELINAISRTNFMTVIGLDFEDVDVWADLEQGYYYGPEHVVRATVRIETIWLRSWTSPLMPPSIRLAMTGTEASEMPDEEGR